MLRYVLGISAAGWLAASGSSALATPVYLNDLLIDVSIGAGTDASGDFNNTFANGATISKAIDASSATALEFYNQSTHIWFTASAPGKGLELLFDFRVNYDISTLHFWNYTSEPYDVDNIDFVFFDDTMNNVGSLSVAPQTGIRPGILPRIRVQDIALSAPLNIRYVSAFLTGTNGEIDFVNIGFTAVRSDPMTPVPLPAGIFLILPALAGLGIAARRRR